MVESRGSDCDQFQAVRRHRDVQRGPIEHERIRDPVACDKPVALDSRSAPRPGGEVVVGVGGNAFGVVNDAIALQGAGNRNGGESRRRGNDQDRARARQTKLIRDRDQVLAGSQRRVRHADFGIADHVRVGDRHRRAAEHHVQSCRVAKTGSSQNDFSAGVR